MSTRFVWNRFNRAYGVDSTVLKVVQSSYSYIVIELLESLDWSGGPAGAMQAPHYPAVGTGYTVSGNKFKLTEPKFYDCTYDEGDDLNGAGWEFRFAGSVFSRGAYLAFSDAEPNANTLYDHVYYIKVSYTGFSSYWCTPHNHGGNNNKNIAFDAANGTDIRTEDTGNIGYSISNNYKGTQNGTVSNAASSTYPPLSYPSKSARIWP